MHLGWKTISGGALAALGQVLDPQTIQAVGDAAGAVSAISPRTAATLTTTSAALKAAGLILGAVGLRHAIAKTQAAP